jgi:hypothetical protein
MQNKQKNKKKNIKKKENINDNKKTTNNQSFTKQNKTNQKAKSRTKHNYGSVIRDSSQCHLINCLSNGHIYANAVS